MVCVDNKGLKDGEKFEKKAGGAPANVAASICKLEGNSYFLGQVGDDFFGTFLVEMLESLNINTSMTVKNGSTTIALVGIDANGERNFDFLRYNSLWISNWIFRWGIKKYIFQIIRTCKN